MMQKLLCIGGVADGQWESVETNRRDVQVWARGPRAFFVPFTPNLSISPAETLVEARTGYYIVDCIRCSNEEVKFLRDPDISPARAFTMLLCGYAPAGDK